jgi:hypothetical protein
MATLPISWRDIATPYQLLSQEDPSVLMAGDRTPTVVRQGSHSLALTLSLIPMNQQQRGETIEALEAFLDANPVFELPLVNKRASVTTGTYTVTAIRNVGDYTVPVGGGAAGFQVGQMVRFNGKGKVYKVADFSPGLITLSKPLRQSLSIGQAVIYSEVDGAGAAFDGVLGSFTNLDFGNTAPRVESSIINYFGPMRLVESLA